MTTQKNILMLLPWLQLSEPLSIRGIHFTPYPTDTSSNIFNKFQDDIARILKSYRNIQNKPITKCVLVYLDETDPCKALSDEKTSLIYETVHLLAFCALSKNEYFSQESHYANYSMFESFFQYFNDGNKWVTLTSRRRDGETMSTYEHEEVYFNIPVQCASQAKLGRVEAPLLKALNLSFKTPNNQVRRLLQSISLYDQAQTDSSTVLPQREVVILASAFEQLFENCHGADDLACKLGTHLDNYGSIKYSKSLRAKDFKIPEDPKKKKTESRWFLHQKWIQEFYQLRNDIIHGNDRKQRTWGWSIHEHLVMASFVFPLLVKLLLTQSSAYQLTEDDIGLLQAVDPLLNQQGWAEDDENQNCLSKWQSTIERAKWEESSKTASEEAWKQFSNKDE